MKELSIGITTYNNDPFIYTLLYEISEQVKQNPDILKYVDFWLYDDKSSETDFFKKVPSFFNVKIGSVNSKTPSVGRNYIIDHVESKYLFFIDGDDVIIRGIIDIVEELKAKDEDILFSSVIKIGADGQHVRSPFIYSDLLSEDKITQEVLEKICSHQTGIWSVYKTKFLRETHIRYVENMRYEDNYFLYELLLNNPQIGIIKHSYYGWRTNFKSFSYSTNSLKQRTMLYKKTLKLLEEHSDNKYSPYILYSIWNQTYSNIIRNYPVLNYRETKDYYKALEKVSNSHKELIKKLKSSIDSEYVDKYFLFTKLQILRNSSCIYTLKKINKVKNSKNLLKKTSLKIFKFFPLDKNKIFMTSQYGQFGSNPKYLFKQLKSEETNLKIKYFVKDSTLIDGKEFLDYNNKILYYYHLYTSKTVYFDTWIDPGIAKRNGQKWIQMWHGYPYKRIYTDINIYGEVNSEVKHIRKASNIKKWDEVYSLDENNTEIFKNLFGDAKIVEYEYERIKWLIDNKHNESLKAQIRRKYSLKDKRYTLFAPTYRPYNVYFDEKSISNLAKSGNEILFNPHPMLKTNYVHPGVTLSNVDIQEILLVCDELITDYSSIQYDFLKVNPLERVKYYQPDIELYKKIHGLYT